MNGDGGYLKWEGVGKDLSEEVTLDLQEEEEAVMQTVVQGQKKWQVQRPSVGTVLGVLVLLLFVLICLLLPTGRKPQLAGEQHEVKMEESVLPIL